MTLPSILNSRPDNPEPQALFREILLSYRLLFGQDKHSWQAFNANFRNITGITKDGDQVHDPLLVRLCGSKWTRERALYRSIAAPEASNHYSAMRDFPLLGTRLARLQHFSEVQNPHDWKVLWYDQRDISKARLLVSRRCRIWLLTWTISAFLHFLGRYHFRWRDTDY